MDHDRFFFTCPFSSQLWGQAMEKNYVVRRPGALSQELDCMELHRRIDGLAHLMYKLSLAGTLYHISGGREIKEFFKGNVKGRRQFLK